MKEPGKFHNWHIIIFVLIVCSAQLNGQFHVKAEAIDTLRSKYSPALKRWNDQNLQHKLLYEMQWKATHSPIFCRLENHWSKSANWAIRMRLGSLPYVNYLEGKDYKAFITD